MVQPLESSKQKGPQQCRGQGAAMVALDSELVTHAQQRADCKRKCISLTLQQLSACTAHRSAKGSELSDSNAQGKWVTGLHSQSLGD